MSTDRKHIHATDVVRSFRSQANLNHIDMYIEELAISRARLLDAKKLSVERRTVRPMLPLMMDRTYLARTVLIHVRTNVICHNIDVNILQWEIMCATYARNGLNFMNS